MSKQRVLLKRLNTNGTPQLYTEDSSSKYHPVTKKLVKAGDWKYVIIDKKNWDILKQDHSKQYEFIDYVGWERYGDEDPVVKKIVPTESKPDVNIVKKKTFDPQNYSVAKFREYTFTKPQLKEFLKDPRKSIVALAEKELKNME